MILILPDGKVAQVSFFPCIMQLFLSNLFPYTSNNFGCLSNLKACCYYCFSSFMHSIPT